MPPLTFTRVAVDHHPYHVHPHAYTTGLTKVETDRVLFSRFLQWVLHHWPSAPLWLASLQAWAAEGLLHAPDPDDAWTSPHHDASSVSTASTVLAQQHSPMVALLCTVLGIPLSCGIVILGLVRGQRVAHGTGAHPPAGGRPAALSMVVGAPLCLPSAAAAAPMERVGLAQGARRVLPAVKHIVNVIDATCLSVHNPTSRCGRSRQHWLFGSACHGTHCIHLTGEQPNACRNTTPACVRNHHRCNVHRISPPCRMRPRPPPRARPNAPRRRPWQLLPDGALQGPLPAQSRPRHVTTQTPLGDMLGLVSSGSTTVPAGAGAAVDAPIVVPAVSPSMWRWLWEAGDGGRVRRRGHVRMHWPPPLHVPDDVHDVVSYGQSNGGDVSQKVCPLRMRRRTWCAPSRCK